MLPLQPLERSVVLKASVCIQPLLFSGMLVGVHVYVIQVNALSLVGGTLEVRYSFVYALDDVVSFVLNVC